MTTYDIQGTTITIQTDVENYRYAVNLFSSFYETAPSQFREWYSKQYDCKAVYKNIGEIKREILSPLLDKCISNLTANKIYSIDRAVFQSKYLNDHWGTLDDAVAEMMSQIAEIEGDQQAAANYRRARKDSRGRWVGGGLGMSGAIKGAMGAGALNAISGAGHGIVNMFGNAFDSMAASSQKSKVYDYYKSELADCTKYTVWCVTDAFMKAMTAEGGYAFRDISKDEEAKASAMMNNLRAIAKNEKLSFLLEILRLDPYNKDVYREIWFDYGDPNGDLVRMSVDFRTGLKEYISRYCEDFAEENDKRYCGIYNNSDNPIKAAIFCEDDIKEALSKLKAFCDLHTISYTDTKYYKKYCDILSLVDKAKRTVEDVTYDTIEEAEAVRCDIDAFYAAFRKCDITDRDEIFSLLRSQAYKSQRFKETLESRIEKEIVLRTPYLLFENLKQILFDTKYPSNLRTWIEIERINNGIRTKYPLVKEYSGLSENEVIILFLVRPSGVLTEKRDGQAGFVITNQNIRIYNGSFMSKENVTFDLYNIKSVECLGQDKYELRFINAISGMCGTDGNVQNKRVHRFTLGMNNLSIENQNKMSELLTKLIFTIQNIDKEKLVQIDRIYKDSVVCTCGTYLLPNELSCPKCHRFMQTDGSFVESIVCPVCNKHLKPLSKFCTGCGHSFTDSERAETTAEDITVQQSEDVWIECGNCHKKIISTKKFCQYCGTPTSKATAKNNTITDKKTENTTADIVCKKCGSTIKAGKKFCSNCGTKINN